MRFIVNAKAVAADRDDVVEIIQLAQAVAQAAHQRIDRLLRDAQAVGAGPDNLHNGIAAADGSLGIVEQLQQAELGQ